MTRKPLFLTTLALGASIVAASAVAENAPEPSSSPAEEQEQQREAKAPSAQEQETKAAEAAEGPRRAIAVLEPTEGNNVTGTITFEESPSGVRVQASVNGLPGVEHAYHVHVYGDCSSADGTSAGPHFRFSPADTGITGNLGELQGQRGSAQEATTLDKATLSGERSIIGRSVVVHRKGNDPSAPPDGAAGARLACGVIGLDEAKGAASPASPSGQATGAAPGSEAPLR